MVLDEIKKKERREGREEGLEEGIEIGKEAGIEIGQSDIVIQLLQKMRDANKVAELIDMSPEAIERIAQNNKIDVWSCNLRSIKITVFYALLLKYKECYKNDVSVKRAVDKNSLLFLCKIAMKYKLTHI